MVCPRFDFLWVCTAEEREEMRKILMRPGVCMYSCVLERGRERQEFPSTAVSTDIETQRRLEHLLPDARHKGGTVATRSREKTLPHWTIPRSAFYFQETQ